MARGDVAEMSLARVAAYGVGVLFLLVGILGFIPGVTTNYETMEFAGHHSQAMLLGVFSVSILHNIVHLLFGVAGFAMGRSIGGARAYLIGGGVIYALLWIYGLVIGKDTAANFVPVNRADDWLHFALAVAMIGLGLIVSRRVGGARAKDVG